jgi:hypothetical protein
MDRNPLETPGFPPRTADCPLLCSVPGKRSVARPTRSMPEGRPSLTARNRIVHFLLFICPPIFMCSLIIFMCSFIIFISSAVICPLFIRSAIICICSPIIFI